MCVCVSLRVCVDSEVFLSLCLWVCRCVFVLDVVMCCPSVSTCVAPLSPHVSFSLQVQPILVTCDTPKATDRQTPPPPSPPPLPHTQHTHTRARAQVEPFLVTYRAATATRQLWFCIFVFILFIFFYLLYCIDIWRRLVLHRAALRCLARVPSLVSCLLSFLCFLTRVTSLVLLA